MNLQTLLFQLKQPKRLLVLGLCIFIGITLLIVSVASQFKALQNEWHNDYANSISQLSNNRFAVSLSNNDLISLQSQVNELQQKPRVLNAVIYDIHNKILVQAGNTLDSPDQEYLSHTTPITLDNKVLGSVTVQFEPNRNLSPAWWFILLLLALLATPLALLAIRQYLPYLNTNESSLVQQEIVSTLSEPLWYTTLTIHINTLNKMYKQLNGAARQQELNQLQETLKKVITLYSGQQQQIYNDGIILQFQNTEPQTAAINAVFCGYLLQQVYNSRKGLTKITLLVSTCEQQLNQSLDTLPDLRIALNDEENQGKLLIDQTLLETEDLSRRLKIEKSTSPLKFSITGFNAHYQTLLDNQLKRLTESH